MKFIIFLLILWVSIFQEVNSQIAIKDSLVHENILFIVNEIKAQNLDVGCVKKYTNFKYFSNRLSKYNVFLYNKLRKGSSCIIKEKMGRNCYLTFYEYDNNKIAEKYIKEIESLMVNNKDIVIDLKGHYYFCYKNIICLSYCYTDDFSKMVKRITGDYLLFPMRLSKHVNKKSREYWNFLRD